MASLLIVGDREDLTSTYLSWLAGQRALEVTFLEEQRFGLEWSVERAGGGEFVIVVGSVAVEVGRGCGVVARFGPQPAVPEELELSPEQATLLMHERRSAIEFFLNTVSAPVANRPAAGRSNGSKPFQMALLAAAGLDVPAWVVTNEAAAADVFAAACPAGCVYKACSGARSRVRRFDEAVRARLAEATSPILLQEYVPGFDVRVHVVGDDVFVTKITAGGTDYRFESEGANYEPYEAPDEIARVCIQVTRCDGLLIGGLDFRVTADGRWYCLELNPVPTFLPYEMSTGQPIGDALLDLLFGRQV